MVMGAPRAKCQGRDVESGRGLTEWKTGLQKTWKVDEGEGKETLEEFFEPMKNGCQGL